MFIALLPELEEADGHEYKLTIKSAMEKFVNLENTDSDSDGDDDTELQTRADGAYQRLAGGLQSIFGTVPHPVQQVVCGWGAL